MVVAGVGLGPGGGGGAAGGVIRLVGLHICEFHIGGGVDFDGFFFGFFI